MFSQILQWIQLVVSLVREVEDQFGKGAGAQKRGLVVGKAVAELEREAANLEIGKSCSTDELFDHVGQVVDGVVAIFNCLGLFQSS